MGYRKITVLTAALLLVGIQLRTVPAAAANFDQINAERIRIIEQVAKKSAETPGPVNMESIYQQLSSEMLLDSADTERSAAVKRRQRNMIDERFPESDEDLRRKYMKEAVSRYPGCKIGDTVNVIYMLHGKPFRASGPFYRDDGVYVWVGSKKIAKATLLEDAAVLLDKSRTERVRQEYVMKHFREYHTKKRLYEEQLVRQDFVEYQLSRGKIQVDGRWVEPRAYVDRRVRFYSQLKFNRELADALKPSHIEDVIRKLETLLELYQKTDYASRISALLEGKKEEKQNTIQTIERQIQLAEESSDHRSDLRRLRELLERCPEYPEKVKQQAYLRRVQQLIALKQEKIRKEEQLEEERRQAEIRIQEERRKAELRLAEERRRAELRLEEERRKAELRMEEERRKAGYRQPPSEPKPAGRRDFGSTVQSLFKRSGQYSSEISRVMSNFSHRDTMADNILQQHVNGSYRMVELLSIMAKEKGCSSSDISSIMSNFSHNDTMSDNVNQQLANGVYRTVELLNLIALRLGCSSSEVSSIMSNFRHRDTMSDNVLQQQVNGFYRTVELLNLIALKLGCSSSDVRSIMSNFSHRDTMADNVLQQQVNGAYRTVELLNLIAQRVGCRSSDVSSVMSTFRHRDTMADNINHQKLNGLYRSVELLALITKALD